MLAPVRRLNLSHHAHELSVVICPIDACVYATMAGWTEAYNEPRVVRAAIAHSANVMGFEVWGQVSSDEWCRIVATFAVSLRSVKDVAFHIGAALKDISGSSRPWRANASCLVGSVAEVNSVYGLRLFLRVEFGFRLFLNGVEEAQLENDGGAHVSIFVGCLLNSMVLIDHFPLEPQWAAVILEEKQTFALGRVVANGSVSFPHAHWANLSLAIVVENAVISQDICVAVCQPLFATYDNDQWVVGRRDDAVALLAIKSIVYVRAPIVDAADLKSPSHWCPQFFQQHANRNAVDSEGWKEAA